MVVVHLSDLHLRTEDDAAEFARQLDCIVARPPDHVVITGDLLDRWKPALLDHALALLAARGLLDRERLTIIHGNHDLASSGGHPRRRADLWRLIARFWDPPPLIAARKREFYRRIRSLAEGVALPPGMAKSTSCGLRFASIDSIPAPWIPFRIASGRMELRHAEGAIPAVQLDWLSQQRASTPLVVLVHHYPLPIEAYRWRAERGSRLNGLVERVRSRLGANVRDDRRPPQATEPDRHAWRVVVPMEINPEDRARFWSAVEKAGAVAVLCGHVHRARLEHHGEVAVGLNGQSGADWAGRTMAYYRIEETGVTVHYESAPRAA